LLAFYAKHELGTEASAKLILLICCPVGGNLVSFGI
jgi:hypothetical protein